MKTVTLFRHTKSREKDNPNVEDFDRPLSSRGLKAAPKIGAAMRDRKFRPGLVLCSPSVRTRETLALASEEAWDKPPKVRFDDRLYEASAQTLLKMVKELPSNVAHVMIVGHNPGLQEFAVTLSQLGKEAREQLKEKFPTGALASFTFEAGAWKDIKPASGKLALYISPAALGHD
jgi:phosphohistidine phosphatase